MRAVLPLHLSHVYQPDKSFVDQCRCLQGVANAFVGHMTARQPPELVVDERDQLFQRPLITAAPVNQQPRDFRRTRTVDHSRRLVHEKPRLG
jgi:hypothetical protein